MSSTTLYRWSAGALIIACLIGLVGSVVDTLIPSETAQQILSGPFLVDAALYLAWALLIVMGLPGLYLRQAARAGALGFVGFVLLWLSLLLNGVALATIQFTLFPYLAQSAPNLLPTGEAGPVSGFFLWILLPGIGLTIGNLLFGIATVRAHIFPRAAGALLIVSGVVFLLSFTPIPFLSLAANAIFFVGVAWCALLLWQPEQEQGQVAAQLAVQVKG